jgi:hypothetical protein
MKPILLLIFLSLTSFVFGQYPNEERDVPKEQIYYPDLLTVAPTYVGGKDSLIHYLNKNLYAIKKPIKHRRESFTVYVQFIVDQYGTVTNPYISGKTRSEMWESDIEIIYKTFINMPKWNPGEKDGKPVSAYLVLPIVLP